VVTLIGDKLTVISGEEVLLMCSRVTCGICKKYTWSGCGQHVEEALAGVPESERCAGHDGAQQQSGFFSRIFGNK